MPDPPRCRGLLRMQQVLPFELSSTDSVCLFSNISTAGNSILISEAERINRNLSCVFPSFDCNSSGRNFISTARKLITQDLMKFRKWTLLKFLFGIVDHKKLFEGGEKRI